MDEPLLGQSFCCVIGVKVVIDREKLIRRHLIEKIGTDKCYPLGNGEFCFTGDFTGLQTFRGNCMSHWGWHSFPLPQGMASADIPDTGCFLDYFPADGIDRVPEEKKEEAEYIFCNPHPLNLARIRFVKGNGEPLGREEVTPLHFCLDIYDGVATACFAYRNTEVTVTVLSYSGQDGIAVRVDMEPEMSAPDLAVEIEFPYPSLEITEWIGDFQAEQRHDTAFTFYENGKRCCARRTVDTTVYEVLCSCEEDCFVQTGAHRLLLNLSGSREEFSVLFFRESFPADSGISIEAYSHGNFAVVWQETVRYWHDFWQTGGAVELSRSKDSRWFELGRRIVLSQYILAVQAAGSFPCAEAGLMNLDSWHGQFHMEMTWWHIAHYALWGRMDMADRQLSCYERFLPVAQKLAAQLGKKGAKWGKQVGPEGRTAPWEGNLSLYWRQPHPIFFAELEYRNRPNAQTLQKWDEIIRQTAEHMADCVVLRRDGYYHLENVMPTSELGFTDDTVFELAYWRWALEIAGKWQERMGRERVPQWDEVMERLAPLPEKDGRYLRSPAWIHTYEEYNYEHPDPVGVYGMLPLTAYVNPQIVKNSLRKVWEVWQKDRIWGWDFAWITMCASRVGEPEIAVDSLLSMEIDEIGANNNGSYPYLPANGGLLFAVAMMCIDEKDNIAPGFPKDGKWVVEYENIMGWG